MRMRAEAVGAQPEDGPAIDPAATVPEPDAVLMNTERAALLGKALDQLGEPCREVIELRYFGDLSHDEISKELNMNPKTVSSRLSKCLDKLEEIGRAIFSGEDSAVFPSNP